MKKFLSRPEVALALTVIFVAASILLNTRFRFGPECEAVSEQFYRSSSGSSIATELRNLCNASEKIVFLASSQGIENTGDAMEEIDEIRDFLRTGSNDFEEIFSSYESLLKETFELESVLSRMQISSTDGEELSAAQHAAAEAKKAIDNSEYNEVVRSFQRQYKHFPTTFLASLAGVRIPSFFA